MSVKKSFAWITIAVSALMFLLTIVALIFNIRAAKVNIFSVSVALVLCMLTVILSLRDMPTFLLSSILSYITYSILLGDVIPGMLYDAGSYAMEDIMPTVKSLENISMVALSWTLFICAYTFSIACALKENPPLKSRQMSKISIGGYDVFIVCELYFLLLLILAISIIKHPKSSSYEGRAVSSYFEYGYILFAFVFFWGGWKTPFRLTTLLMITAYTLIGLTYGARAGAFQLLIVVLLSMKRKKLNPRKIIAFGIAVTLTGIIVGMTRHGSLFAMGGFSAERLFEYIISTKFLNGTSALAAGASTSMIQFSKDASFNLKLNSAIGHLYESLGLDFLETPLQKSLAFPAVYSSKVYYNMGGTIFPVYFFFWFGWSGVIISSLIFGVFIYLLSTKSRKGKPLASLMYTVTIASSLRWALYAVQAFIRPAFVLVPFLYYFFMWLHQFLESVAEYNAAAKERE